MPTLANNRLQRTAMCAAAEPARWAVKRKDEQSIALAAETAACRRLSV